MRIGISKCNVPSGPFILELWPSDEDYYADVNLASRIGPQMRLFDYFRRFGPLASQVPMKLSAQQKFLVSFDDESVMCRRPNGVVEGVRWLELESVAIQTTDAGPALCDVFFVLVGKSSKCVIPQEAEGASALLQRLQLLPNFDYQAAIRAMSCVDNQYFQCWSHSDVVDL